MTILVTGATGAVGRHLVAALVDHGEPVRAVSRKPYVPEPMIAMLLDYWSDTGAEPDQVRGHARRTLDQWACDHRAEFV